MIMGLLKKRKSFNPVCIITVILNTAFRRSLLYHLINIIAIRIGADKSHYRKPKPKTTPIFPFNRGKPEQRNGHNPQ